MAFSVSSQQLSSTPNITPLIDVLLVLLIIFMVISPVTPRGLPSSVPSPSSSSASTAQAPIIVRVLPAIHSGERPRYRLDGLDLDGSTLGSRLQLRRATTVRSDVWVGGDPGVDYRAVVTAISAARRAGFSEVGLLPRQLH